jgi:hypothetical protein
VCLVLRLEPGIDLEAGPIHPVSDAQCRRPYLSHVSAGKWSRFAPYPLWQREDAGWRSTTLWGFQRSSLHCEGGCRVGVPAAGCFETHC